MYKLNKKMVEELQVIACLETSIELNTPVGEYIDPEAYKTGTFTDGQIVFARRILTDMGLYTVAPRNSK